MGQQNGTQTEGKKMKTAKKIYEISENVLGIETLKTRNSDSLDFHNLAVWQIKEALEAAYQAGRASK